MTVDKRDILERVARGDLTPEEAEALLEASSGEPTPPPPPTEAPRRESPAPSGSGIRCVRVEAGFGAISIVGDHDVAEAEIDGPHSASVEDDTLVISGDFEPVTPGVFAINLGGRRSHRVRMHRFQNTPGLTIGRTALRIRMNPTLCLDAKIDAGPMQISGIDAPIRARSGAGPITIDGVIAPVDAAVNAGAIRITGLFTEGDSRVRSDAGAIRIELSPGSDVAIAANAALGKVVLPGLNEGGRSFGSTRKVTIGRGTANLRIETAMGSIQVLERSQET